MARDAKAGGADALLAFPRAEDPVAYHQALGRELPVIAFYLYEAAGGVAYDNPTLHALLSLTAVVGIKVATLDSVMTFQRIAGLIREHHDKLLITGEDRLLGYSLTMGARAALVGMGAALTDGQVALLEAFRSGAFPNCVLLAGVYYRLAGVTLLDAWGAGNSRASSGGETRVIRRTYGPRRVYTVLAARSLALWREHERRWKRQLYYPIGVLWLVEEDDQYERAALPILKETRLAFEELDGAETARRYPQINCEQVRWAILERDAGYLTARLACEAVLAGFLEAGGED